MKLLEAALARRNQARPPVWFMRQAGRYHSHYQALRKKHSFIDLCKRPEVACEATLGPVEDFGFDSAILFSDLLFPLEAMGMGLKYDEGPKLDWHLRELLDLRRLQGGGELASQLAFQAEALRLIRARLRPEKALLGFVGGPLTLFCYAVEGSHSGSLARARAGLRDGLYAGFLARLYDLLAENIALQHRAGTDAVAILDTCAGEVDPETYREIIVPSLQTLLERLSRIVQVPILYYSKGTGPAHWHALRGLPIVGLGIDWRHDLAEVLKDWSGEWAIQGNIDPEWLFLEPGELEKRLRVVFEKVRALPPAMRQGWICGLGHGVLPKTPESNVRLFLRLQKEIFGGGGES